MRMLRAITSARWTVLRPIVRIFKVYTAPGDGEAHGDEDLSQAQRSIDVESGGVAFSTCSCRHRLWCRFAAVAACNNVVPIAAIRQGMAHGARQAKYGAYRRRRTPIGHLPFVVSRPT